MFTEKLQTNEEQLHLYYSSVLNLKILYQLISQSTPNKDELINVLDKVIVSMDQLRKEDSKNIRERMKLYEKESIINRQYELFHYINDSLFFDMENERNEEIEKIISKDIQLVSFNTIVLSHNSIYSEGKFNETTLQSVRKMNHIWNCEQYLFWLKDYYPHYTNTLITIMEQDSFLPKDWKYYIAIMAISPVKNTFLLNKLEEEFLFVGGDPAWLIDGINVIPSKLKGISRLNIILANQPWILKCDELNKLKPLWNVNELSEAAMIMILYHKIASIEESISVFTSKDILNSNKNVDDNRQNSFLKKMKEMSKMEDELVLNGDLDQSDSNNNDDRPRKRTVVKHESGQGLNLVQTDEDDGTLGSMFGKYLTNECKDLPSSQFNNNIICTYLEFNWLDHGIHIMNNFLPCASNDINEEIANITNLTSGSFGNNHMISTSPFIRALSNYTEKLFGYYHEDYEYSTLDELLKPCWKTLVKKIACYQLKLSSTDITEMNKVFRIEEIFHIIMLVVINKMRIQLVYYAKAINDVMKCID